MACKKRLRAAACVCLLLALLMGSAHAYGESEVVGSLGEYLRATRGDTLENMRHSDTMCSELGAALADAVRKACGAEIAVVENGCLAGTTLLDGEVTWGDIRAAVPEERELAVCTVTPKTLRRLLERGVSHLAVTESEDLDYEKSAFDGFPQISGFTFVCDVSAAPGERVTEIRIGGESVDLTDDVTGYTLASTAYLLDGGSGYPALPCERVGMTNQEALAAYIAAGIETSYRNDDERVTIHGTNESKWLFGFSRAWFLAAAVVLSVGVFTFRKRKKPTDSGSRYDL